MAKLTLVLGGTKSGKSLFAENLIHEHSRDNDNICSNKVAYLATAEVRDKEMAERVIQHKKRRSKEWQTIEAPLELESAILSLDKNVKFLMIDCITLYITNLLLQEETENNILEKSNDIMKKITILCDTCKKIDANVIMVSNEVGLSIVSENKLARVFTDIAGKANQVIAQKADEVYFVVAGIAQKIK